jgi:hypothetical protein
MKPHGWVTPLQARSDLNPSFPERWSLGIQDLLPRTNNQPGPPHWLHCGSALYPTPSQDGHSAQSLSSIALWFVPLHVFLLNTRPHFRLARPMLYPGVPQSVQDVTGLGRFIKGLLVQYNTQERSVDLKAAVVFDEAQFSELVHEEIDA